GHLPRHLHARRSARNLEVIVADLFGDVEGGTRGPDRRQQIAKVAIERPEPFRQLHDSFSGGIESNDAIIDVHHVRRLNEGMIKVLVSRIDRVVDLERAASFREVAANGDIAEKLARRPGSGAGHSSAGYRNNSPTALFAGAGAKRADREQAIATVTPIY